MNSVPTKKNIGNADSGLAFNFSYTYQNQKHISTNLITRKNTIYTCYYIW